MIESRADFEWQKDIGPELITWFDEWTKTIEALREVARASEDLLNWHDGPLGRGPALDSAKARLQRSLDALSNWLKDG